MKRMMIAGCCVLASYCAVAQEGAPAGLAKKAESAPAAKVEQLTPEVEAWVKELAKKIAATEPQIRDSAIAGIERIGKPALPILNALASGSDKAIAEAAKKLADRISKGQTGQRNPFGGGLDNAMKEMKLDDAKQDKVRELQKKTMDKMREGFEAVQSGDMTREEMREEMTQYREDMKKELRKFLSEDEAKKIEEAVGRMGGGMGGRRPGEGGTGGGGEGGGGRRRRDGGGGGN